MKKIFLSAILAGAVIAFGGTVFLSVENTVVGSLFFTIGLFVADYRFAADPIQRIHIAVGRSGIMNIALEHIGNRR